jgi:hypothetical protein
MKPQREHFIPKGAIKITPRDLDAVIYIYQGERGIYALGFSGKRNRPDFHYSYRCESVVENEEKESNCQFSPAMDHQRVS